MLEDLEIESVEGIEQLRGPFANLKPKSVFTPALCQYSNIDTFVNLTSQNVKNYILILQVVIAT